MSHVTIIDPHHPLAGRRFPVVSLCAPQGPHKLVVALPDGRQRAVRRSVTDLGSFVPIPSSQVLSGPRLGARTLLALAQAVRGMLANQEMPDAAVSTSVASALDPAAPSLAADVARPTTATRATLGTVAATDAALSRKGEGTC